jgi:hypothetical protein
MFINTLTSIGEYEPTYWLVGIVRYWKVISLVLLKITWDLKCFNKTQAKK